MTYRYLNSTNPRSSRRTGQIIDLNGVGDISKVRETTGRRPGEVYTYSVQRSVYYV